MENHTSNFIGKQQWSFKLPEDCFLTSSYPNDMEVIILRTTTFFYIEQKTTFGALRKIYTEKAIDALLHDEFIKIK